MLPIECDCELNNHIIKGRNSYVLSNCTAHGNTNSAAYTVSEINCSDIAIQSRTYQSRLLCQPALVTCQSAAIVGMARYMSFFIQGQLKICYLSIKL